MKKALMVVGTSSYAGKSLIVTALCRIFKNAGHKTAPFKAQNMSLNSAVTKEGKEISRAQALQAMAAGIEPSEELNPILLKPKGDGISQIVLNGMPYRDVSAAEYYDTFVEEKGADAVKEAFENLRAKYDVIVMEGAGSPVEINLYEKDIANFRSAEMAGADVVLVADIERGGAFASIYGTLHLLRPEHRQMVKGVIINKFRGDRGILQPALDKIEKITGVPVIGVVPFIDGLRLPAEDSQSLSPGQKPSLRIAVVRLPRISNFTDFDPLAFDHRIDLSYIKSPEELENVDSLIIPGTKSTIDDLLWLDKEGFTSAIKDLKGRIPILGICGGYQILGRTIRDNGVESGSPSTYEGLGLLDVETAYESYDKTIKPVHGSITADKGIFKGLRGREIAGYEIHMGSTRLLETASPVFSVNNMPEGAADDSFTVVGTYLHGVFDSPSFREGFIRHLLKNKSSKTSTSGKEMSADWEKNIESLASAVKKSVDLSWFI